MDSAFNVQELFSPEEIQFKTMKTMDRAAAATVLGAGLVQRAVRFKCSEVVITHYYVLLHIYG